MVPARSTWNPVRTAYPLASRDEMQTSWFSPMSLIWLMACPAGLGCSMTSPLPGSVIQSPTIEDLFAISQFQTSDLYVVGAHGMILHSSDDGVSWSAQSSGIIRNLHGIGQFYGDMWYLCAVGDGGSILRSNGNGIWTIVNSGTSNNLYSADYDLVVGQGGTILRSTDGCASFTTLASNTTSDLFAVRSSGIAFAIGQNGTVITSDDQGMTWTPRPTQVTRSLHAMGFGGMLAFVVGDVGTILRENQDRTWALDQSGTTAPLIAVTGFPPDNEAGEFLYGVLADDGSSWTSNGGTWISVPPRAKYDARINAVAWLSSHRPQPGQLTVQSIAVADHGVIINDPFTPSP